MSKIADTIKSVVHKTAILKYHGSIDHGMGRCDPIADGSITADLTADESVGVNGAINGMKSPYVGSVPGTGFED
ncbi:MAG: hypothetical protein C4B59_16300 [Candidatus Methanogaster sp.]|uniref:Uncharacterized protein n=1 Tax=Candidatus Methanogaster sp. TaxID=3386292 RepID=A0AC61KY81_9EURY|nr:MAG: hypothetical protein C4B59_16300 [ANME-2 cluster archaeon]